MSHQKRETILRFLAEPTDVNFGGKVHGGAVMKWIDQVGYACAVNWSESYCVTAYVAGIQFYRPIFIGNMVEMVAKVVHTGRTSMHIGVDVLARDPKGGDYTKTTRCLMVFVAVDDDGKPVKVPVWKAESAEDKLLEQQALQHLKLSNEIHAQMESFGP